MTGLAPGAEHVDHADVALPKIGVGQSHGAFEAGETQRRRALPDEGRGHCHGALGLRRSRWPGSPTRMNKISYTGYRFPPEIIHQAIWLYLRFTLSLRDVEDLLAERGVAVSYETVRRWVNHFGPMIAA